MNVSYTSHEGAMVRARPTIRRNRHRSRYARRAFAFSSTKLAWSRDCGPTRRYIYEPRWRLVRRPWLSRSKAWWAYGKYVPYQPWRHNDPAAA